MSGPYPAAMHAGPGHMVVHANEAFRDAFGEHCLGRPAREVLVDLPREAFELMDLVYGGGKPLAIQVETGRGPRRLVVAARRDPETGATYGVTTHLKPVGAGSPRVRMEASG